MNNQRQQKINHLIQKDLGEIFLHEVIIPNTMITVTYINITPDMSVARVNLSIFAVNDKQAALKQIKQRTKEIRNLLAQRIKNQLRIIPELQFFLDESLDKAERINELLQS
ncbi:MAG: 30S ribosome-binding factor RbfA [Bacteroidales bacterium]|jgi:ribosome-binding factor A|nr:30S ribosome-binding factor RbfA [Bacteroidales bacterium]